MARLKDFRGISLALGAAGLIVGGALPVLADDVHQLAAAGSQS